jgi:outer membrane receptor protein involved in Fe transport
VASGFPYTAAQGVRAVAIEDPEREGVLIPERDAEGNVVWGVDPGGAANLNDARLPAFARLDARLTYRPKGPSGRWLLYLEVINVTNRDNVAQVDYTIRFDPETGDPLIGAIDQQGGLPLLPTFGVRFRW